MTKVNKLEYSSIDGTRLAGILLKPRSPKQAVILMHGINVDKDEWAGFHRHLAEELFKQDIASLRFDFRGHGQSGGKSVDVSLIGEILDIRATAHEMSRRCRAPLSLIATSFSAGPAIFASTELPDVRRLALIAPVLDYVGTFLEPDTDWALEAFNHRSLKRMERTGYITLDERRLSARLVEEMRWLTPWRTLSSLRIPVLLIHGDKDSMVPYRLSSKHFKPKPGSRMITIERADHGYADEDDESGESLKSLQNRALITSAIAEFVLQEPPR